MPSTRREDDSLGLLGSELLGRYLVEATLAYGGMSVVYRGQDTRLHRPVCIKVFFRLDGNTAGYQKAYDHFVQEAFALSQLAHPNTLRIYDFGHLDQEPHSPFQVSELLTGGTVSHHVRRAGPFTPSGALDILEAVIGALSEAHARGVIHRDIKPSNVLFGSAGPRRVVKLADFGIAKALAGGGDALPHQAEDTGIADGVRLRLYSPGWAAPEQLRGDPIGPATDTYAVGLLAAFLLTGRPVFKARTAADMIDERVDGDAHIAEVLTRSGLPAPLIATIARACRDDAAARYRTVDDFGVALRAAVAACDSGETGPTRTDANRPAPRATTPTPAPPDAPRGPSPSTAPTVAEPLLAAPLIAPPPPSRPRPIVVVAEAEVEAGARPLPAPPPSPRVLVLEPGAGGDTVAAGRRLRWLVMGDRLDVGGPTEPLRSEARLRLTLLPDVGRPRLHVKGLNCFVARVGERPSSATALVADGELELWSPDRRRLDGLRCSFGVADGDGGLAYALGDVILTVPAGTAPVALLDVGPGRELALLHRPGVPPTDGGRR